MLDIHKKLNGLDYKLVLQLTAFFGLFLILVFFINVSSRRADSSSTSSARIGKQKSETQTTFE